MIFTGAKYIQRKIFNTNFKDMLTSRMDNIIFYYIVPNLFFLQFGLMGFFEITWIEGIIISGITMIFRNVLDTISNNILKSESFNGFISKFQRYNYLYKK